MAGPVKFGGYLLHERIAVGGMAEVYRATLQGDEGFERTVAIKCLLPHLAEDDEIVRMFTDEAKIAVQLAHPNIVEILDLGFLHGRYYIAQDFVDGRDLKTVMDREASRGGTVARAVAVEVAMRAAEALHHAHDAVAANGRPMRLIHRDVSPQNILVSFEGEVKVVDFGLAKAAIRASQTGAGVVKGKLAYMSPEQSMGQPVDRRSDVFALGICLWEMLAGRPLFLRQSEVETVLAVQQGDAPSLRAQNPHIPGELERIVLRALEPDPGRRFQTALEMHDELEAYMFRANACVTRIDMTYYMQELFADDLQEAPNAGEIGPKLQSRTTMTPRARAALHHPDRAEAEGADAGPATTRAATPTGTDRR